MRPPPTVLPASGAECSRNPTLHTRTPRSSDRPWSCSEANATRFPTGFWRMSDGLQVWIDQELCTGDGLCVQYAPEVFEFDVDGLAYVKEGTGDLLAAPGARARVPASLHLDVISSAKECP